MFLSFLEKINKSQQIDLNLGAQPHNYLNQYLFGSVLIMLSILYGSLNIAFIKPPWLRYELSVKS